MVDRLAATVELVMVCCWSMCCELWRQATTQVWILRSVQIYKRQCFKRGKKHTGIYVNKKHKKNKKIIKKPRKASKSFEKLRKASKRQEKLGKARKSLKKGKKSLIKQNIWFSTYFAHMRTSVIANKNEVVWPWQRFCLKRRLTCSTSFQTGDNRKNRTFVILIFIFKISDCP